MATVTSKQQIINQALAAAAPVAEPDAPLPVLEQFIYGICRENATPEQAQVAYENLRTQFFDWNEVRVSAVREIEEAMEGMADTERRAERIISFLQEVFETDFSFDLEKVHKKGLKQGAAMLTHFEASSDFVAAWVVQRTLGGHAIPVDDLTVRQCRRLSLIDDESDHKAVRATLEHLVPKAKGTQFTDAISVLAGQAEGLDEVEEAAAPVARVKPR